MSEMFEGIVCHHDAKALRAALNSLKPRVPLTIAPLADDFAVAYVAAGRYEEPFSDEMIRLSQELSGARQASLLLRYDTRVGLRESTLFANGTSVREWTTDDELFAPLDERGMPVTRQLFTQSELDPAEEYEPVMDAIKLGLDAIGALPLWPRLEEIISSQ